MDRKIDGDTVGLLWFYALLVELMLIPLVFNGLQTVIVSSVFHSIGSFVDPLNQFLGLLQEIALQLIVGLGNGNQFGNSSTSYFELVLMGEFVEVLGYVGNYGTFIGTSYIYNIFHILTNEAEGEGKGKIEQ